MRRILFPVLVAAAVLVLASVSCGKRQEVRSSEQIAHADSIMEVAHLAHDNDRILLLADSLERTGDFSRIKADYWRGYSYYTRWNQHKCQEYWYEAIALEIKSREDLVFYGRSANRLADVLVNKGDFEAALRVALPAIKKLEEENLTVCRDYAFLQVSVGCCELASHHLDMAASYFDKAHQLFLRLIEDNGEDGGATHEDNLKSAVAGYTTIARHYLEENRFASVLLWVDRLDYVMEDYRRQPETTAASIDRRQTLGMLFRAAALEGLGRKEEASDVYDLALKNPFCSSAQGRVESAKYLMLARRWDEAADNFQQLTGVASIIGAGLTLDNIQHYILPKFRANFNARRDEEALATGIKICDALDSAIVWNRNDKAAELATIYHTQEIKQEVVQQKADIDRLRFIVAIVAFVLLLIGFVIFVIFRRRASRRLEEANRQLARAKAQAEESSRVKSAFLQQISHEIRTPLNLLTGFAQLLTTPGVELDEETRAQINNGMIDNTGRITGLVSKILELSDLISRTELDNNDRITAGEIAAAAADQCGIKEAKGIRFSIQATDPVREQELVTNRSAALRILGLLLENAVKFTGEGQVSLRIVTKEGFVYFLVEDTGIGVPPEQAEHIFEHFVQLDDYREGTGIGLSLARSLARRLGGDVVLDTSYSFGARFVFSLPVKG